MVRLGDVLDYEQPTNYIVSSDLYDDKFSTPVLTAGKSFILGYTNETEGIFTKLPVIIFDDFTTESKYVDFQFKVKSSAMKILKAKEEIADTRFMFYLLQTIKLDCEQHKRYWISQFVPFQIPLPPLPVQKRIAEILDAADALRRKDQQLLKKYDELAQAIFMDMFGDPVKNEKGVSLTSLIKINPTKSEGKIEDNTNVTFVPMSNVGEDGEFNNTETRKYLEVKFGFTYFREGDVLFAKITPCMENGKGAIARNLKNGIGFGSTEFHVLRPNEKLNSHFLFHLTKLPNFRVFAEANMTGSAGQKRVPTDFFEKIKIDISKLEKQNAFAKAIDILALQKQIIIKELINSENLFQTLLQQAFKSELMQ